jgi:hypothetical protein
MNFIGREEEMARLERLILERKGEWIRCQWWQKTVCG